jgi:hypothetical protein
VRPIQCKTYPFWNHILQSKQTWISEKRRCQGIGKGKLYTLNDINTVKLVGM